MWGRAISDQLYGDQSLHLEIRKVHSLWIP